MRSMADKPKTEASSSAAEPGFQPKAVHIGGESFVDRVLPHIKKIALGAVLLTLVLSVYYFVRWMGDRKEIAETEKLASVLDIGDLPIRPEGMPEDKTHPSYANAKERAAKVLDEIAAKDTAAAGHAYKGAMLMDSGRVDDAIAEYRLGEHDAGIEGVLAREGLGIALETKALDPKNDDTAKQKGLEEALAAYKSMQPDENGPRSAYAYYHQGRILQKMLKKDEAKAAYQKAKELGKGLDIAPEPGMQLTPLIDNRLAELGAS